MLLSLVPWTEIENYLQRSRRVIVPIGSIEQHGPTGPMGTDAMCAQIIGEALGEATNTLVTPPLSFGMALHHLEFPGSISLRPSTLMAVVCDVVLSLARHGLRDILFVNGHGGNTPSVKAAFSEAQYQWENGANKPLRCIIENWWQLPQVKARCDQLYGDLDGAHAAASEIALAQFMDSRCIRTNPDEQPAPKMGVPLQGARDFRMRFPDGRIGSLTRLGQPEHGREFVELSVQDLTARMDLVFDAGI